MLPIKYYIFIALVHNLWLIDYISSCLACLDLEVEIGYKLAKLEQSNR